MEAKFTPGPWVQPVPTTNPIRLEGGTVFKIRAKEQHANPIVFVAGLDQESPEEGDANAHLIAAAPELYEALAMLEMFFAKSGASRVRQWERVPAAIQAEFITAGLSALAKARGEKQ